MTMVNPDKASSVVLTTTREGGGPEAAAFPLVQHKEATATTVQPKPTDPHESKHISAEAVEKQVQKLQEIAQTKGWYLNISMDKELSKTVIKVFDKDSKELIRQIPSEELLALSKRLKTLQESEFGEQVKGLLFDQSV
ncbi:flagellar protein FlaG [Aeromonas schubertii]|uniref:flagellar protein FlaG n=1 Tax=Aeromonas schubertii TaxID=652 RepID=UPI001D051CA9|nr:flagellar protein FlaG [Aeromonas schubertii]